MNRAKRRKWEKRICFLLVVGIIFLLLYKGIPDRVANVESTGKKADYYATTAQAKKVISLVYDDSASMSDGGNVNWAYANFAFQAFIGLLGENDELYVTYMSSPKRINLLASPEYDRQGTIDTAKSHFSDGATPMAAVTTAFNKLDEMPVSDVSTEYWLVVITDGYLQMAGSTELLSAAYINQMFTDYSNTILQNGSPLNVVYMGIGDNAPVLEHNENNKAIIKYAKTEDEIISKMNEIAQEIEKWDQQLANFVSSNFTDSKTLVINTQLPLERMLLLEQKNTAKIKSITKTSGDKMKGAPEVYSDYDIRYPTYPGQTTDEKLNGQVTTISAKEEFLSPGQYTVTFSDDVRPEEMNDVNKYRMYVRDVLSGTSQDFKEYLKISNFSLSNSIKASDKGNVINSSDTAELTEQVYEKDSIYVETTSDLKGSADESLSIKRSIQTTVPVPHKKLFLTQIAGNGQTIVRPNIIKQSTSMQLKIFHDNTPYTAEELQNMRLSATAGNTNIKVKTTIREDGVVILTPYYGNDSFIFELLFGWHPSWTVSPGDYQINLTFYEDGDPQNFVCKNAFTIQEEPLVWNIIYHLTPFLWLIFIWGYFRKARFSKHLQINFMPLGIKDDLYIGKKENWVRWNPRQYLFGAIPFPGSFRDLLPWLNQKRNNWQITLEAIDKDANTIRIRTLKNFRIVYLIIREDTISRQRDVQIHLDSDRLSEADTNQVETDESVGLVVQNDKTGEKFLYLITFDRKNR